MTRCGWEEEEEEEEALGQAVEEACIPRLTIPCLEAAMVGRVGWEDGTYSPIDHDVCVRGDSGEHAKRG